MTKTPQKNKIEFAFFGTSRIAVGILDELERAGYLPSLVVATPDAAKGRGMKTNAPPTKVWAEARDIDLFQPETYDSTAISTLKEESWEVFIVTDYGKILPQSVLDIPKRGCLNVHFSLLPRYRGASPIRSAIVNDDKNIGTSIMLLVESLDEGPIVAKKPITSPEWPPRASALENLFIRESGQLLSTVLPEWLRGNIEAREQNHDLATYCDKIEKTDGFLDLKDDTYKNLLKIYAYEGWPGTYTFFQRAGKKIRVQIIDAHIEGSVLVIDTVKPEGKKEMRYEEFLRSGAVLL